MSAWELLSDEDRAQVKDCDGRLRAVHVHPQETHRGMSRTENTPTPLGGDPNASKNSIAEQHTHHLFVETGLPKPTPPVNDPEDPAFVLETLRYEHTTRKAERNAILSLMGVLCTGGEEQAKSRTYGSFGIKSDVIPVAFLVAGGTHTLMDALEYVRQKVPLVLVDGCVGASAVIAKRYMIAQAEKAQAENRNAENRNADIDAEGKKRRDAETLTTLKLQCMPPDLSSFVPSVFWCMSCDVCFPCAHMPCLLLYGKARESCQSRELTHTHTRTVHAHRRFCGYRLVSE